MTLKRTIKFSPLHIACQTNQLSKVAALLKAGTDPNVLGPHRITPLMEAASRGFGKIAGMLLAYGANVNLETTNKETALAYAISNNHLEISKAILKAGASANCHIKPGVKMSALTMAAGRGYVSCVKLLLTHGANVEGWKELDKPIALAARNKHLDVVRVLLEAGANPNSQGIAGNTPLSTFAANGLLEGVKLLFARKADVNVRDSYGMTAFIWACHNGHLKVAKFLLENRADPLVCDTLNPMKNQGDNALLWAAKRHHVDLVKWLIQKEKRFPISGVRQAKTILSELGFS